jgi:multiple sugar transport system substrate-binding protein
MRSHMWAAAAALALGAATAGPVRADVEFMTWTYTEETGQKIVQTMMDGFSSDSGVTVVPQGYAWGEMMKNYLLRARSANLPDVGQVQGRLLPILKDVPGIVDFNTIYSREELEARFTPGFLAMGEVDGKQIALPWIGGTVGWVANQEVLDAAGVTEMPTTIDEFREALVKVRDNVPNSVPFGMATKNENSIVLDYMILVATFGGRVITDGKPTVNSPEAVAALTFATELVQERLAAPEIDRPDARRLFGQGATAFFIDAPVARTFARQFSGRGEEIDGAVKPIPGPVVAEGGTPVSIQWGHVITLFGDENAAPDSDAVKWIDYLLSDDVLVAYATDQSTLPATASGQTNERVTSDQYLADWAAASVSPIRHDIASLDNGAEVSAIIGEEFQAAILGQKSPEQAANDMQARLEAAMAD